MPENDPVSPLPPSEGRIAKAQRHSENGALKRRIAERLARIPANVAAMENATLYQRLCWSWHILMAGWYAVLLVKIIPINQKVKSRFSRKRVVV